MEPRRHDHNVLALREAYQRLSTTRGHRLMWSWSDQGLTRAEAPHLGETVTARKTTPETPPPAPVYPEMTSAEIVDKAVRAARSIGYCSETDGVLARVFGDLPNGERFRDSDGLDVNGDAWRDRDGYDRNGYNVNGYNRDGFNAEGYDRHGFNAEGLDREGLAKDDPSRFVYDRNGYTAEGFNRAGLDRNGYAKGSAERAEAYKFDRDGFDSDGYDRHGYDRLGMSRAAAARRASRANG